jgi:cell filamentation protein, protein adenylyltransferase
MEPMESRAGKTVAQPSGYLAYIPAPLPPNPRVELDEEAIAVLSRTDQALGKLEGIASHLPNPNLFVGMYVRKEALLSSQIEGIDSTLDEVIRFEEGQESSEGKRLQDTEEVVNYVRALNFGIGRLPDLPISLRLTREIHAELMQGVRGHGKAPGEFRVTQNWIGPKGATLATATFVPPPVPDMTRALDNLEKFVHERNEHPGKSHYPIVIECALIHAQFETIHPFLDGNGRLGRLLIALLLHERRVLSQPLLYLSLYLKANRLEYYDRLTAVRKNGDWEGWIKFFLKGVEATALEAVETAKKIIAFRDRAIDVGKELGTTEQKLIEFLFGHPLIDIQTAQKHLGVSYNTAAAAISKLEENKLLREMTGKQRNRVYRFSPYLDLFEEPSDTSTRS